MRFKLVLAAAVFILLSVSGRLPGSSAAEPGGLYVAMGDSLTQITGPSTARYPERFFDTLQEGGAADALSNIGVNGETSGSILGSQRTSALQLINDPGTDTTVVTVDIGGNDVLGGPCPGYTGFSLSQCQPALQAFAGNFATLLGSLNEALATDPGDERLLVLEYFNPASGRSGAGSAAAGFDLSLLGSDLAVDCGGSGDALGLNDLIACVGAEHGADPVDVYPPFLGKGDTWFVDMVHPNDLGQQAIADVFAAAHANVRPVAAAGPDQSVGSKADFDLDAGGSSDPEGGPLAYRWEQVAGPAAVIRSPRSSGTRVTGVSGPTTLTFRVHVTDPLGATDTDEVVVTVRAK